MITISVERGLIRLKSWDDMLETPGFTRDIDPKVAKLKEVLGVYAFESKQPCGLKNCRQPHGNGYLVATTDGHITNLGSVCGKNNFSVAFTSLRRNFDNELRSKERRERLDSLKSRLPSIRTRVDALKTDVGPYYSAIRQLSGDTGSAVPQPIVDAVRLMRRSGDGAIQTSRRATRQELEIAVATGSAREGTPFYVTETIGRLSNIAAMADVASLRSTLQELEPALIKLETTDVEVMSEKEARNIDRLTAGLDSRLDKLQLAATSLKTFATKGNLAQLAKLVESNSDRLAFSSFLASLPGA
jgi:hypothetical protein